MLDKALKRESRERLESTLRSVCTDHPAALKDIDSALVKTTTITAPAGGKRRPGHLLCVNPGCDAEFDPTPNSGKSCTWHSGEILLVFSSFCPRDLVICSSTDIRENVGEIEVDEGEWDDWEERTHGSIDSAENREEYPKGFAWDCCGEKLDSKKLGCVKGPHQEVVQRRIIRRDRASFSYY